MARTYEAAKDGWEDPRKEFQKILDPVTDKPITYLGIYPVGPVPVYFRLNKQFSVGYANYVFRGQAHVRGSDGHILKKEGDECRKTEKHRDEIEKEFRKKHPCPTEEQLKRLQRKRNEAKNVSVDLFFSGTDESDLKRYIARRATELCEKHKDAIRQSLKNSNGTAVKTLNDFYFVYEEDFFKDLGKVKEDTQKRMREGIGRVAIGLSRLPVEKVTAAMVRQYVVQRDDAPGTVQDLTYASRFWDYCLKKKYFVCDNPIAEWLKKYQRRSTSPAKALRSAAKKTNLTVDEERLVNAYVETHPDEPMLPALILAKEAGFTATELSQLQMKDLTFRSDPRRVYVQRSREYTASATQNYQVPLSPWGALQMEKWRDGLLAHEPARVADTTYVCGQGAKAVKTKTINDYIRSVLRLTIGLPDDLAVCELLRNNLHCRLTAYCGLGQMPGAVNFLLGNSLANDTTSDHYRSFVDQEGQEMLYRSLARDRRFYCDPAPELHGDGVFKAQFSDKRNCVRSHLSIKANQYFTVEAPHGALVSLDRVVKEAP